MSHKLTPVHGRPIAEASDHEQSLILQVRRAGWTADEQTARVFTQDGAAHLTLVLAGVIVAFASSAEAPGQGFVATSYLDRRTGVIHDLASCPSNITPKSFRDMLAAS